MKKVAILQSNYIPWKGYFDMINMVDEFVIYDEVQFTKNDWRNRNLIKTKQGVQWLTIPCRQKQLEQRIDETEVSNPNWPKKHWNTLITNYSKSPHFKDYSEIFEFLYFDGISDNLSEINLRFIFAINRILNIRTKIVLSKTLNIDGNKNERLVKICKKLNADIYLSGPAAKDYLDISLFESESIQVEWMNYSGYPEYHQLYSPFEHEVSILDLLFNEGVYASEFMKSFKHE